MSETLPMGTYVLSDPCYVISDWDAWLEEWFGGPSESEQRGGVFEFKGLKVCAFYTKYGDGVYESSEGHCLGVDSGSIGLIPLSLCDKDDEGGHNLLTFVEEFEVSMHDGQIRFGDLTIHTDDTDETCYCG